MVEIFARFRDNNITYRFVPQKDITTYELALLLPLAHAPRLPQNGRATEYLIENNLMRHFTKEELQST